MYSWPSVGYMATVERLMTRIATTNIHARMLSREYVNENDKSEERVT